MKLLLCSVVVALCLAVSVSALSRPDEVQEFKQEIQRSREEHAAYLQVLEQISAEGNKLAATPLRPLSNNMRVCNPRTKKPKKCKKAVAKLVRNTFGKKRKTSPRKRRGGKDDALSGVSVEDALSGVDVWLKHFKKRIGNGQSLWGSAEAAVRPLLNRLKRTQQAAVQRLIASNHAILEHVREVATEHIYQLLMASRKKEKEEETIEKTVAKKKQLTAELKEKEREVKNSPLVIKLEAKKKDNKLNGAEKSALKTAQKEEKKLEKEMKKSLGV